MKYCEQCRAAFDNERVICPDCGASLINATPEQEAEANKKVNETAEEEATLKFKLSPWQIIGAVALILYAAVMLIICICTYAGSATEQTDRLLDCTIEILCVNLPVAFFLLFPSLYYRLQLGKSGAADAYQRKVLPRKSLKGLSIAVLAIAVAADVVLTCLAILL